MIPTQIKFHGVDASEALTSLAEDRAQRLAHFTDRIVHCRVFIEAPHHRHRHGNHFQVRIDSVLPGEELVVGRTPERQLEEDPYRAVDHAFDVLERILVDDQEKRRHNRPPAP